MASKNKGFSLEEKLAIIKEHLIEKIPVSQLCEKYKVQPSVYYGWQKTLFERGSLEPGSKSKTGEQDSSLKAAKKRIDLLETKLAQKDSVLAQVMEDYVELKKSSIGES